MPPANPTRDFGWDAARLMVPDHFDEPRPDDHLLLAATRRLDAVPVTADAALDACDVPMLRV